MGSNRGKAVVFILVFLIIVSLFVAGGIYYYYLEHQKNISLQTELGDLKSERKNKEAEVEVLKRNIYELDTKLKDNLRQVEQLNSVIEQERSLKSQAQQDLEQLKEEIEKEKNNRSQLEIKLNQADNDLKKAQSQLQALEAQKTELQSRFDNLEQASKGVELGKIVVSSDENQDKTRVQKVTSKKEEKKSVKNKKSPSVLDSKVHIDKKEGRIIVINKDYNFAVIDLGNVSGIKLGDIFAVYQNDKNIGDLKVEKIHDSMAAAGFLSPELKNKIKEGDRAIKKE